MLKTRIILAVVSLLLIFALFKLPKVVVDSDTPVTDSATTQVHNPARPELKEDIARLSAVVLGDPNNEKNTIFADSLADLYAKAGRFDSAAWYAERVVSFSKTLESLQKAGDMYYQAYTFSMDQAQQAILAEKARSYYLESLALDSADLTVKSKLAMTYLSSQNPMQGILLLREVIAADPKNEEALFNLGMLSIQSGQNENAVARFEELLSVNPNHIQGNLLLGVALANLGENEKARTQFERVKSLNSDPAVQATVDSYLKDLK